MKVWSITEFRERCGDLSDECLSVLTTTYPILKIEQDDLVFQLNLYQIFSESMDLFTVDPTMVADNFTINEMFRDEALDPKVTTTLMDLLSDLTEYDPIGPEGDLWMTFSDLSKWYGERFDVEMQELFPQDYAAFKEYFIEN